jgi:hypothetical protein
MKCPHCDGRVYYNQTKAAENGAKGGSATGPTKSRGGPEYYAKLARARWKDKPAEK